MGIPTAEAGHGSTGPATEPANAGRSRPQRPWSAPGRGRRHPSGADNVANYRYLTLVCAKFHKPSPRKRSVCRRSGVGRTIASSVAKSRVSDAPMQVRQTRKHSAQLRRAFPRKRARTPPVLPQPAASSPARQLASASAGHRQDEPGCPSHLGLSTLCRPPASAGRVTNPRHRGASVGDELPDQPGRIGDQIGSGLTWITRRGPRRCRRRPRCWPPPEPAGRRRRG